MAPSNPKLVDCTIHNQCWYFLENGGFSQFWSKMVQCSISHETLKANFAVKNQPIFAQNMSKEALWTGAKTFFDSLYPNDSFLRNSGPLKIRLLQCYVVLWIHNIDAICIEIAKKTRRLKILLSLKGDWQSISQYAYLPTC